MSGKVRMLFVVVLLLLVAGGAYLGWRHFLAAPVEQTVVDTEPSSGDATAGTDDLSGESMEPGELPGDADLETVGAPPSPAPAAAPLPQVRGSRAPQNLNSLIAEIKALHAACLEKRACTEAKWWDVSVRLYATGAPVHLQELYAAVSRSWRSHLEAGPSADIDREFAIRLMNRAREWGY